MNDSLITGCSLMYLCTLQKGVTGINKLLTMTSCPAKYSLISLLFLPLSLSPFSTHQLCTINKRSCISCCVLLKERVIVWVSSQHNSPVPFPTIPLILLSFPTLSFCRAHRNAIQWEERHSHHTQAKIALCPHCTDRNGKF